mgnify:CR=1 FL=1
MTKRPSKKTTSKEGKKKKKEDLVIEISQTRSEVKSFLEKFKAEVAKKKKGYQEYAQESQMKKNHN